MNPIVRIDGTNYRLSVRVIRYLPGILADGQTDIATVPQVMVGLTRVDGQAITRPLNPPMIQLGHPGDRPATVTLARAISNEPQSALWIGEGINNWANDVQLRARLGIQTSRGTVSVALNELASFVLARQMRFVPPGGLASVRAHFLSLGLSILLHVRLHPQQPAQ
jgi:hypothetical protein